MEHKYSKGAIVAHRLTDEKLLILWNISAHDTEYYKYRVRKQNYELLDVIEEEIKEVDGDTDRRLP